MAFIQNTTAHVIGVSIGGKRDDNNTQGMEVDNVRLVPGMNTVKDSHWKAIQNHPIVKAYMKAGDLKESSSGAASSGGSSGGGGDDLSTMTVAEAHDVIAKTYDTKLLAKWQSADDRKGVQDAIDKQLKAIESEGKDQ